MATSILANKNLRWAIPASVTAAIVGAAVAVPMVADADSDLPDKSVAQLLTSVAQAEHRPFSATVVYTADMGLPDISGLTGASGGGQQNGATDFASSIVSGSTTARIWWVDGSQFRVALQDDLSESDVIRHDDDVWLWSSADNSAKHLDLSTFKPGDMAHKEMPSTAPTPKELTDKMFDKMPLADMDIEVDGTTTVADRAAYELVVSPKAEGSLIDEIRLAIDGEFFVPLRAQVFSDSDGEDPSVEFGFESVSFDEPDDSVFAFEPPEGATVEEFDPSQMESDHDFMAWVEGKNPTIVGEGWESALVISDVSMDDLTSAMGDSVELSGLSEALMSELETVSGPYGTGMVFESDLMTAMLLDDGRLLVGPVTLDVLEKAATSE